MKKITKIAKIVKRKNEWCVMGASKDKSGTHRNFGCYPSREEAKKRLAQVEYFKHRKSELLGILVKISNDLDKRGKIHIADAITACIKSIVYENTEDQPTVKLGKVICLLERKNESSLAEQLDTLLPEILCFEGIDCDIKIPTPKRINAKRAYNIAKKLKRQYLEGEVDEKSFEFSKMKELEVTLKEGFSFPAAPGEKLPEKEENWWDYFSKKEGTDGT